MNTHTDTILNNSSAMLLQDILRRSVKMYPETVAVDDGEQRLTYGALAQRVDQIITRLQGCSLSPQRHIAVFGHNSADYVALYFACAHLNLILVPMNSHLKSSEITWILNDCQPAVIVASSEMAIRLNHDIAEVTQRSKRFVTGHGIENWDSLLPSHEVAASCTPRVNTSQQKIAHHSAHTIAVQMYTSGTTGTPKGVMLSHHNIVSVVSAWRHEMPLTAGESRFMQATPLFHVGGMLVCLCTLASGATLHLLPRFDAVLACEVMHSAAITHTLLVPSMIQQLLLLPDIERYAFTSLKLMIYGASCMPQHTLLRARQVFGCDFLQGYGLTETGGVALSLRPEDHCFDGNTTPSARLRSAGREISCCEVRVVNAEGNDIIPGEIGEIIIRGNNVTPGYWKNPEGTATTLIGGWLHTGDLATIDAQGYITIADRLKDMIITGGENVYPAEIENILSSHSHVAESAVIGLPNLMLGEEVVAVIVLHPEQYQMIDDAAALRQLSQSLKAHCHAQLAPFKCPVRIKFRTSLPRTPAGKIQKNLLRNEYRKNYNLQETPA